MLRFTVKQQMDMVFIAVELCDIVTYATHNVNTNLHDTTRFNVSLYIFTVTYTFRIFGYYYAEAACFDLPGG